MTQRSRGFSLIEVLVALVVVSVGLLGLAKMETLALSSTSVAGVRSVVAGQTANLASMMHANQDYWQNTVVAPTTIITSAAIPAAAVCQTSGTTACSPQAMAAYDLNIWATALKTVLPVFSSTITCGTTPATGVTISCAILVTWPENAVAMNSQQTAANIESLTGPTYILYVQP